MKEHVRWGAGFGALAGLATGLLIVTQCGSLCHEEPAAGMALHLGMGTLAGAGAGAVVYVVRRSF